MPSSTSSSPVSRHLTLPLALLLSGLGGVRSQQHDTYDYVIAGAGTCGLVVANRLSADPNVRVAVIEPGGDERDNPLVTDPSVFTASFGTSIDWNYTLARQPGTAEDFVVDYHQGLAIGGTSTINGMTYVRGDRAEFDAWEAVGNEGWNWDALYPYMKRAEQFTTPTAQQAAEGGARYDPTVHGSDGPVSVGFPASLHEGDFYDRAVAAWKALGYPLNEDANGGDVRGLYVWPQTLDYAANERDDAARAYYHPVEHRPNLDIIKGTVTRMIWTDDDEEGQAVAEGVEYVTPNNETRLLGASREVVLSAGAIRTPLILEMSGVGNRAILESYGVSEIKVDLPGVGENLQDQPNLSAAYQGTLNVTGFVPYATFATAADLFGGDADALAELAASTRASLPDWARRVSDANGGATDPETIEKLFRIQHDLIFEQGVTIAEILTTAIQTNFINASWLLLPFSWGSVHLKPRDQQQQQKSFSSAAAAAAAVVEDLVIDPKYLLMDFDVSVQTATGRLAQELWYTDAMRDVVVAQVTPTAEELPRNATDEEWRAYFSQYITSNHHALGTAAMRSRDLAGVVDPELKVYDTRNVRVVDASVLPFQFSGHLTAVLYAVAERASEIIVGAVGKGTA